MFIYSCVSVFIFVAVGVLAEGRDCPTGTAYVDGPRGYLLGGAAATSQQVSGTDRCPWIIRVQPGQKVRILLYDFSAWRNPKKLLTAENSENCPAYAVFRELDAVQYESVCNGHGREKLVYFSKGSEVHVNIVASKNTDSVNFLLKYEGISTLYRPKCCISTL